MTGPAVFVKKFTRQTMFDPSEVILIGRESYLLPPSLRSLVRGAKHRPVFAGIPLGMDRGDFRPSVQLLDMLARTEAKRVMLRDESAWLFVCGRPALLSGVMRKAGDPRKGDTVLVLDRNGESLGCGLILADWNEPRGIIKPIFDIGDFLRREKGRRVR